MSFTIPTLSVYLYVDGENHYRRSEDAARASLGAPLESLRTVSHTFGGGNLLVRKDCALFWDTRHCGNVQLHQKYYYTSFVGNDGDLHEIKTLMRAKPFAFDPEIVKEDKNKRKNRLAELEQLSLIEKPKGADIALAVRMLEDAANNNFATAYLFTSDADFLPLIKAVRRMGKYVVLFGFRNNLGNQEMAYAADEFIDLSTSFTTLHYSVMPPVSPGG